jgi:Prenyltransferase and squalene oxidase repeat
MNQYLSAATQLHKFIMRSHWNGSTIVGPDPIGRINWRITRFIRSYLSFIPWSDQYVFYQGLGYWIISNLNLGVLTGETVYREIARKTADYIIQLQRTDGGWSYTLPERRHLVGIIECLWASLGLLAVYRYEGQKSYLDAVLKSHSFLISKIGFSEFKDSIAPNFFDHPGVMVPNAATLLLWFLAELQNITGNDKYMQPVDKMIRFLNYAQMSNGELEYAFQIRSHFMCYQYNSFQFLDLAHYYQLTGDKRVQPILIKLAAYLETGVSKRGSCRYNCNTEFPEVNYWTAALASALRKAHELEIGEYQIVSDRAFNYLLSCQRADGSFDFSVRNYGWLHDTRSYPRCQAMILYQLVYRAQIEADTGRTYPLLFEEKL